MSFFTYNRPVGSAFETDYGSDGSESENDESQEKNAEDIPVVLSCDTSGNDSFSVPVSISRDETGEVEIREPLAKEVITKTCLDHYDDDDSYLKLAKTITGQHDHLVSPTDKLTPWFDRQTAINDWINFRWSFIKHSMAESEKVGRPSLSKSHLIVQTTSFDYTVDRHGSPIMHIYGLKDDGRTTMIKVHGFLPYFYVEKPEHWSESDIEIFIRMLSKQMYIKLWYSTRRAHESGRNTQNPKHMANIALLREENMDTNDIFKLGKPYGKGTNIVCNWSIVKGRALRKQRRLRNKFETDDFIKIEFANPSVIVNAKNLIMNCNGGTNGLYNAKYPIRPWMPKELHVTRLNVFEANVAYTQRFITDLRRVDNKHADATKNNMGHYPETCLSIPFESLVTCKSVFEDDKDHWPVETQAPPSEICKRIMCISNDTSINDNVDEACSTCDLEYSCEWKDIDSTEDGQYYERIFPRRMCTYDIEVPKKEDDSGFGTPDSEPIIDICTILNTTSIPNVNTAYDFILERDLDIDDDVIDPIRKVNSRRRYCFEYEQQMLHYYRLMIVLTGVDVLSGHNVYNYDNWYLMERAKYLGVETYKYLGRNLRKPSFIKETVFNSSQRFMNSRFMYVSGLQQLDTMEVIINTQPPKRSYSLNSLAEKYFKRTKDDVDYDKIRPLFMSPHGRTKLRKYCSFDSLLTFLISTHLQLYMSTIAFSRVIGISFQDVLERGQQFRVFSMIVRYAGQQRDNLPHIFVPCMYDEEKIHSTYTGAVVIEPKTGLYYDPVVTLDFAGLYPSIMMAYNLGYMSQFESYDAAIKAGLVPDKDFYHVKNFTVNKERTKVETSTNPSNPVFLNKEIQPDILPMILYDLRASRSKYKRLMASVPEGSMEYNIYNIMQNAFKLVGNSVYGFTGAERGFLPCVDIAFAVTYTGQLMNAMTCEATYKLLEENNIKGDIIYGDTDSIMILFLLNLLTGNPVTLEEAEEFGQKAAKYITQNVFNRDPIALEYEKLFMSMLLKAKKRYAGRKKLYRKAPEKEISVSGLECKRRDNCQYLVDTMNECLDNLLMDRDIELMKTNLKKRVCDMVNGRVNIMDLVITKKLTKLTSGIVPLLYMRMKDRDPSSAPAIGSRVPYVVVREKANDPFIRKLFNNPETQHFVGKTLDLSRVTLRGESPLYLIQNPEKCEIDWNYYSKKMIADPIKQLLEVITVDDSLTQTTIDAKTVAPKRAFDKRTMIKKEELDNILFPNVASPHTIQLGKPWKSFTVQKRCAKCNVPTKSDALLCTTCIDTAAIVTIKQEHASKLDAVEQQYTTCYNKCIECTEGNKEAIDLCNNMDCKIFMKKAMLKMDRNKLNKDSERIVVTERMASVPKIVDIESLCDPPPQANKNSTMPVLNLNENVSISTTFLRKRTKGSRKSTPPVKQKKLSISTLTGTNVVSKDVSQTPSANKTIVSEHSDISSFFRSLCEDSD